MMKNLSIVDNVIQKELPKIEKKEPLKVEIEEFLNGIKFRNTDSSLHMVTGEEGLMAVKIAEQVVDIINNKS